MKRLSLSWIFVVLVIQTCRIGFAEPGSQDKEPSLVRQVQNALKITPVEKDIRDVYLATLKDFKARRLTEENLDPLVSALVKGDKSNTFFSLVIDSVHINDYSDFQFAADWKLGSYSDQDGMALALWRRAKSIQSANPKKAAEYARASVLLAAEIELFLRSSTISAIIVNEKDAFVKVAMLTEDERVALYGILDNYKKDTQAAVLKWFELMHLHDYIIASKEKPELQIEKTLAMLQEFRQIPHADMKVQFQVLHTAWQILNIEILKKNNAGETLLREFFKKWESDTNSPHVQRWIKELLDLRGGMPEPLISDSAK